MFNIPGTCSYFKFNGFNFKLDGFNFKLDGFNFKFNGFNFNFDGFNFDGFILSLKLRRLELQSERIEKND